MKSLILSLSLIVIFNSQFKAQVQKEAEEKAFKEGSFVITAGYGFPNIYKSIFKAAYGNNGLYTAGSGYSNEYGIKGIGPAFLKLDYGLSKVVSLGASIGYYDFALTRTESYQDYSGSSSTYTTYTDITKWKYTSLSAGVRVNFHFGTGKKLDPYAGVAGGYSSNKYVLSTTTNNPNSTVSPPQTFNGIIPVYFAMTAGLRYYFTPNIGIYGEIGIDKWSVIQGGLAVKF